MRTEIATLPVTDNYSDCKIHPCYRVNSDVIECQEHEAEFWGVYLRKADNPIELVWIADVERKVEAYQLVKVIRALARNYRGE